MSDLPMKQEDHPAHNVPTATEDHRGTPPPVFRYRTGVEISEGAMADGSDGVAFNRIPIGPGQPGRIPNE